MAQVNDFENGVDTHRTTGSKQRFPDEANKVFTYSSEENLLDNLGNLSQMIRDHEQYQRPRLQELEDYYKGNNVNILSGQRRKEEGQADNRAVHNFAKYTSQFIQGYMVGIPLKTSYPDEGIEEKIRDMNRINDADEHNSDLILSQSMYGRAYELLYRSQDDQNRFTTVDVKNTFVVYDSTVEKLPIAGIRYLENDYEDERTVYVYTGTEIIEYTLGSDYKLKESDRRSHSFGEVPIIEYSNDKFRQGDFEDVLTLIDLYDGAQSDIANYSQDLIDAILAIFGRLDLEGYGEEDQIELMKRMKKANLLRLEPPVDGNGVEGKTDAKYLYKQYDVQGSEAYKSRLANDIHLFTATPNMNDENFGGVQSGEAMKYKLFLLEQKRATKERLFKKSLRNRYRLINNVMKTASEGEFDISKLTITFTENLPANLEKELKWFTDAGGKLSLKTLLSLLRAVENPDEEIERIEEEESKEPLKRPVYDYQQIQQSQNQEVVEDDE